MGPGERSLSEAVRTGSMIDRLTFALRSVTGVRRLTLVALRRTAKTQKGLAALTLE
jgi:hypothetical protein